MTRLERLSERIFPRPSPGSSPSSIPSQSLVETTFALLDAAREEGIYAAIADSGLEHASLYEGADDALREVSPYLVRLEPHAALTERLLDAAWGRSWGLFVRTSCGFAELRRHLRTFLRVRAYDGRVLYFRYYDPRVLRAYLPTCHADELKQVFGPIQRFLLEGEEGLALETFELVINFQGRLSLDVSTLPLPSPEQG